MPYKDKEDLKQYYLDNKEKLKQYYKQYRLDNKEKLKQYYEQYYLDNKEKINETSKKCRLDNKEKIKEYNRQYRLDNKEKKKQYDKQYRLDNKEKKKQYNKQWRLDNKEKKEQYNKQYYLDNREKLKQYRLNNKDYHNKYQRHRLKTDPIFKIIKYQRIRMRAVLKGKSKCESTIKLLGCSAEYCWNHLEQKFKTGMTRDNYGLWHVDHIIPCASFDLNDPEQQKICFHYTNLQPLWAIDNMKKGAKLDYENA